MATVGFIVRNAVDAGAALDLAEPDALDFNMLSRPRFGVLSGCDMLMSGRVVTVSAGIALVDDVLVRVGGQVDLPTSSQDARFDLITVDTNGVVGYIRGQPSPNPIYPSYDNTVTILAAVYITPGTNPPDPVRDITDKRRFINQRFVTSATSGVLLGSYAPGPPLSAQYTIDALGTSQWGDTKLSKTAAKTLTVDDNLVVSKKLTADSGEISKTLLVHGDITAANLLHGNGTPGTTGATGTLGDLYQDQSNGGLWAFEAAGWGRISTVPIPAGSIMPTMRTDEPLGWLRMDGRSVDKNLAGTLWDVFPEWRIDANNFRLPDARGCFLRQGTPNLPGGAANVTLQTANLPPHKHLQQPTTEGGGEHIHAATMEGAGGHEHNTDPSQGAHDHDVDDPMHAHIGVDGGAGGAFIGTLWQGPQRLDGPFNDASHPKSVGEVAATNPSITHVTVKHGGPHSHRTNYVDPHTHPITVQPFNSKHVHGIIENSVGDGQRFDILPPFLGVNYLIKT